MAKRKRMFLAFDTSCYTTSISVVSDGKVIYDNRIMLDVPQGRRGLRQSEAVFKHVKNMRQLFLDYAEQGFDISAASYSEKPCPKEASYMPVFTVGQSFAAACASMLGVTSYPLTHQHGHIYAAFFGNDIFPGTYCALHVSGGTLELLHVEISDEIEDMRTIGGTKDITCGQLIDRIGVAAGLPFPSGRAMEEIYRPDGVKLAVGVSGLYANLSGAETQAQRMIQEGVSAEKVCSGVIDCSAKTISLLVKNAAKEGYGKFVFTGGVICNTMVREAIAKQCAEVGATAIFAKKRYCSDNACGLALAVQIKHNKETNFGQDH